VTIRWQTGFVAPTSNTSRTLQYVLRRRPLSGRVRGDLLLALAAQYYGQDAVGRNSLVRLDLGAGITGVLTCPTDRAACVHADRPGLRHPVSYGDSPSYGELMPDLVQGAGERTWLVARRMISQNSAPTGFAGQLRRQGAIASTHGAAPQPNRREDRRAAPTTRFQRAKSWRDCRQPSATRGRTGRIPADGDANCACISLRNALLTVFLRRDRRGRLLWPQAATSARLQHPPGFASGLRADPRNNSARTMPRSAPPVSCAITRAGTSRFPFSPNLQGLRR